MEDSIPQSVAASGVAFEIPIEKKPSASPSSIQLKLDERANSPRREIRLEDIDLKLSEAQLRRQKQEALAKSSTTRHTKVQEAQASKEEEARARYEEKEAKREEAEAKREGARTSWVGKLAASLEDKMKRGQKAKEEEVWNARELETKLEIKGIEAELRRNEATLDTQDSLAQTLHDRRMRGKLALGLAALEAKQLEIQSHQKLAAAEERKERAVAGKVALLESQASDKTQRAADMRRKEEELAREKAELAKEKAEAAAHRREQIVREQQQQLIRSASKKEKLVVDKRKEEEEGKIQALKDIQAKLVSADERKEQLLQAKVEQVQNEQQRKQAQAKDAWLESLNESKELQLASEKKLKQASNRKQKLMNEILSDAQEADARRVEKINVMNKQAEREEMNKLAEIEQKIAVASAKRENHLKSKSTSKKRPLSPRPSPTNSDVEARIEAASRRRAEFLASKVEKAAQSQSKSPRINKALFASVSPAPSMKESRSAETLPTSLDEFQRSGQDDHEKGGGNNRQYGLGMPLLAGGIAIVLVGLISFLKR